MSDDKLVVQDDMDMLASLSEVTGVVERPKTLDPNDRSGTDNIGLDELRLPRLAIAQQPSPQLIETNSRYIVGLKMFDLFNDRSDTIYGRGPITFVPLRRTKIAIEWDPENRGVPIDLNVPVNDPRTKWTKDENNEGIPPIATTYVEFIILLLLKGQAPEPIVLSIPQTNKFQQRAADNLTLAIKLRTGPIYSGLYTVECKPETNDEGTFGVYIPKNAGFIPKDTPAGLALFTYAKQFAESLEGKVITVDRQPGEDDFNPAEIEQARTAEEAKVGDM